MGVLTSFHPQQPPADAPAGHPDTPAAPPGQAPVNDVAIAPVDAGAERPPLDPRRPLEEFQQLIDTVLDPVLWMVLLQRFVMVALVIVATMILLRITRRLLKDLQENRNLPDTMMLPLRRIVRGGILLFAAVVALQFAGFEMDRIWTGVAAVLAVLGVAFIAIWSVLSNISCSFFLMIFKPFRIGDHVEILEKAEGPNIGGRVTDVTLMYVVLREESSAEGPAAFIQVPNNIFFQRTIRRRAGKRTVGIEQHVEKHGLTGREQSPPQE